MEILNQLIANTNLATWIQAIGSVIVLFLMLWQLRQTRIDLDLQRQDIKLQKEEMERQSLEMKRQADAQEEKLKLDLQIIARNNLYEAYKEQYRDFDEQYKLVATLQYFGPSKAQDNSIEITARFKDFKVKYYDKSSEQESDQWRAFVNFEKTVLSGYESEVTKLKDQLDKIDIKLRKKFES